jgi:hypothetical protein
MHMKLSRFLATAILLGVLSTPPCLAMPGNQPPIQGKIIDTMDSGGYTYIQVDTAKRPTWVAIPQAEVTKGQQITLAPGMVMNNFESKTLGRSFETIIFSPGQVKVSGGSVGGRVEQAPETDDFSAALQAEQKTAPSHGTAKQPTMAMQSAGSAGAIVPSADITVEKADGDNAFTIGEIFEKRKELTGKTVRVRGKVMKMSPMIMGKNWLHLQDGTGNPMINSHDLVVTTMATPSKDDVVICEGTIHADKDFGAGYRYDVIMEDALVQ